MKKKSLLLALGLLGALSLHAQASPYKGSEVAAGTYYLYNVETGKWLQDNDYIESLWTTHAALGDIGIDVELRVPEGEAPENGFLIYTRHNGDGLLCGVPGNDLYYMDQPEGKYPASVWEFEKDENIGISNAYHIYCGDNVVLSAQDGELAGGGTDDTWQLVSREERVAKLAEASGENKLDATFLIPWYDLSRNNLRGDEWYSNFVGGNNRIEGANFNSCRESWDSQRFEQSITLTNLPNGTYEFSVQGYYRDGGVEDVGAKVEDGSETIRAEYFAGAVTHPFVSIIAGGSDEEVADIYFKECAGKWIPDNLGAASRAFAMGGYQNEPVTVAVTNGTLKIGVRKATGVAHDWTVFDNFRLTYLGTSIDLTQVKAELNDAIQKAENIAGEKAPFFTAALAAAKAATSSNDATEINNATVALTDAINEQKKVGNNVDNYNNTLTLINQEGVSGNAVSEAKTKFESAKNAKDVEDALRMLRDARKNKYAQRQANVFAGNVPAEGEFYLYNVGQQRFLTGGSDWGAHAALGMPGTLLKLESSGVENCFHINTGLRNGGEDANPQQYLSYRGYMDAGKAGAWKFIALGDGKYNIVQADFSDVFVKFNPSASTDRGNNDFTTVGTEERNVTEDDADAQWMLVTKAERDALLEKASEDNPVDASYLLVNPGFNQRAEIEPAWNLSNASVWERGANHSDFALESFDSNNCLIAQTVNNLKPGYYVISCQGFYRDGNHEEQARLITEEGLEPVQNAYLYSGEQDTLLLNITAEVGKAPGLGAMTSAGEYPDGIDQACQFFQNGLYNAYILVKVDAGGTLDFGVAKDEKGHEGDWVVVDNFRLTYYGTKKPNLTGINTIVADTVNNGKIYNLQGVEVQHPTQPGIYIKNGKKFVIK
ncbi:MAG: hypothetical protein ACOYJK_03120 [Prevotella sp.]